jgi:nicotinamide phosphoribosyltransferase
MKQHIGPWFPYNYNGWKHVLDDHGAMMPVEIKSVKEGTVVPVQNAIWTMRSTCPKCVWVPGWMETTLEHMWYGSAVATRSRMVRELFAGFLAETADDDFQGQPYQLHDFGGRGVTCNEQAAYGAAAHMINFKGTDTKVGMDYLRHFYGAPKVAGYSVPATEHSVTTTWGRDGEGDFVAHCMEMYPEGILSIVGDTYDIFNFCREIIGGRFRDQIRNRKGKIVVRPDSGPPAKIVIQCLEILAEKFGFRENSKGYKELPPCIGMIWGDGMDYYAIRDLLQALKDNGWSASVIVVGMGGGLLQKLNRDTQKVAIKGCNAIINGVNVPLYKEPITDPGKNSKRGRVGLVQDTEGHYHTVQDTLNTGIYGDLLELVYLNGEMKRFQTYDEICQLAALEIGVAA